MTPNFLPHPSLSSLPLGQGEVSGARRAAARRGALKGVASWRGLPLGTVGLMPSWSLFPGKERAPVAWKWV